MFLGFYLMPDTIYACDKSKSKTEKQCCKKEASSLRDYCCCSKAKNKKHNGCGGKCGHSNCTPSNISFTSILTNEVQLNLNSFDFSNEKQKFYLSETNTSKGFCLMWLIPKIG
jgi:hypothetical protein